MNQFFLAYIDDLFWSSGGDCYGNGLEGETDSEGHLLQPTHGELRLLAVDEDSGNEGGILVLDYEGQCGYKEL